VPSLKGSQMIASDFLEILRCPLNPSRTRLVLQDSKLICERCALCFPIKDGFPILVAEEAELPPGCEGLADLPCQKADEHPSGANNVTP
jgi:uncharacterized protein YbaR (Trm112 family)